MEPAHESAGRLLDGRPEAVPSEAPVVVEERRQDVAHDLVTGGGPAAVYEAHHVRIAVELDEVVDVIVGETSQHQALGLQKDLHRRILPYPGQALATRPRRAGCRRVGWSACAASSVSFVAVTTGGRSRIEQARLRPVLVVTSCGMAAPSPSRMRRSRCTQILRPISPVSGRTAEKSSRPTVKTE